MCGLLVRMTPWSLAAASIATTDALPGAQGVTFTAHPPR